MKSMEIPIFSMKSMKIQHQILLEIPEMDPAIPEIQFQSSQQNTERRQNTGAQISARVTGLETQLSPPADPPLGDFPALFAVKI